MSLCRLCGAHKHTTVSSFPLAPTLSPTRTGARTRTSPLVGSCRPLSRSRPRNDLSRPPLVPTRPAVRATRLLLWVKAGWSHPHGCLAGDVQVVATQPPPVRLLRRRLKKRALSHRRHRGAAAAAAAAAASQCGVCAGLPEAAAAEE